MDVNVKSLIQKLLGLQQGLSEMGLFRKNTLQLPLQSISLGVQSENARLILNYEIQLIVH